MSAPNTIRMQLSFIYHSFLRWLEHVLSSRYWLWILIFSCIAISLFIAFPPYSLLVRHLNGTGNIDAWHFIEIQAQDLLHPTGLDVYIRRENMVFRWFLPFLSMMTGHNIVAILLLQALAGVFFLYFSASLFLGFSGNRVQTALFTLALANVLTGSVSFVDIIGYGDGFACFFLVVCLITRKPLLFAGSLFASFLVDERALVAAGLVALWWMVREHAALGPGKDSLKKVATAFLKSPAWVVVLCWLIYLTGRFYIKSQYFADHTYSTMGTPVLFATAHRAGLGSSLWTAFEGMWLLLGGAFLILFYTRRYYLLAALCVGMAVLMIMGIFVHDIDRALAYGFPLFFMAGFILVKAIPAREVRLILFFTALICVFHPLLTTMGYNRIIWTEPLPVKIVMFVDRQLGWGYFD